MCVFEYMKDMFLHRNKNPLFIIFSDVIQLPAQYDVSLSTTAPSSAQYPFTYLSTISTTHIPIDLSRKRIRKPFRKKITIPNNSQPYPTSVIPFINSSSSNSTHQYAVPIPPIPSISFNTVTSINTTTNSTNNLKHEYRNFQLHPHFYYRSNATDNNDRRRHRPVADRDDGDGDRRNKSTTAWYRNEMGEKYYNSFFYIKIENHCRNYKGKRF